ncbi:hypothetical protein [Halomonas marinisediminis]|uniref:Chromosome partition protein Smc n=1 Tax=Halomonas marinisediminis TaxID=2546095 RepID=A0ABY2DB12_9GAMM|nr:hypothetical protein [Halomonas marinisediminis]TDB05525.1 hypothetical protein E0702_00745 [Halomonas marinisediminis]
MAERPEPRRYTGPIVPDPEASLAPYRPRWPEPPRIWPLWLLVLILAGALVVMGWFGWQERQRLVSQNTRLSGELSNIHARFDTTIGEGDGIDRLKERVEALTRQDETHERHFDVVEEDIAAGLERLEALVEEQRTRLTRMGEAAANREALLSAFQESLDALERAGEQGRRALAERLDLVSESHDASVQRLAELQGRIVDAADLNRAREEREAAESRLAAAQEAQLARLETLQARVATLADALEGAGEAREDRQQQQDALRSRLAALETDIGEMRRSQLALSARLEALRP